jgi:cytochrome b561
MPLSADDAKPVRYHGLAITLHWVMAVCFLLMLGSGLAMANLNIERSLKFQMFQWHKSLGVLLLLAFFLRLAVRLSVARPALPDSMKPMEKLAAEWGHRALYVMMLAMPMTGWALVSSSKSGLPTIVFGLFEWPHIPAIAGNTDVHATAGEAHELLAYVFMAMIAGHVAAVIKHAMFEKENLLPRMGIGHVKKDAP